MVKLKDKKALSLSSLSEAVIGILLILLVVAIIIIGMNVKYDKSYDPTLGLGTNDTVSALNGYQGSIDTGISTDATTNSLNGVNLVGSWGMVYSGVRIMLDFVTGAFIQNAIGLLHLGQAGTYLGWAFRLLFVFGVAFIIIKLLFKVKP